MMSGTGKGMAARHTTTPRSGSLVHFESPTCGLNCWTLGGHDLPPSHREEARDIESVRAYRANIRGNTWRIVRGDIHRHTDLSWDGNRDGSLDDSYRYAMDAADFDYLGVCDHQAGQSIPYNWWRLQKAVDMYTIRGRFTPLYSYERSVRWPNGHRNVLFSMRGRPVLDVTNEEEIGQANTGNALFPYLHKYNGVSSPHTSGSGMGTDFRDNDPAVEPLVEIYQGYRSNFETLGAPRAPTQQESTRIYGRFRLERMGKGTEAWGAGKLRSRFNAYLICGILCRPSRSRCHHLSYESAPFLCSNG